MIDLRGNPFYLTEAQEQKVESLLSQMTQEEKIHQLFCVLGDAYSDDMLDRLVSGGIGGVLFRPVRSSAEISEHFKKLDALAKYPLLHAANLEEGGAGASSDGTYFANQLGVAASMENDDAVRFALVCAAEGKAADINWTFSPVSDLDMNFRNPITNCRTAGSDLETVKRVTGTFVEKLQESGMAACAKHFPGDGVDFRDQHLHPTYNTLSANQWRETYGAVYRNMIQKGLLSVMVGHICQPAMEMEYMEISPEETLPGSLSKGLITGVLRRELGFNGVVATDATIMGGYTMAMPRAQAIPATFNAGIDMVVFSTDIDEDMTYVRNALADGTLSMERVNEAVTRILALKLKICGQVQADPVPAKEWQRECADHSVTLVKNLDRLLPVSSAVYPKVRLMLVGEDACWDGSVRAMFTEALEKRGFSVEAYDPFADDLHGTSRLPKDRLTLLVLNYPHASNQVTVRPAWCPKHALEIPRFVHEEPTVVVSLANPYHLQDVPRARTFINAYTPCQAVIEAVVSKLCGESAFTGKSPVDAFCGLFDTRL